MRLTQSNYEQKYEQALLLVRDRFKVGRSYRNENGERVCVIANALLGFDYDVFTLAWGKAVAEQLTSKRTSTQRDYLNAINLGNLEGRVETTDAPFL